MIEFYQESATYNFYKRHRICEELDPWVCVYLPQIKIRDCFRGFKTIMRGMRQSLSRVHVRSSTFRACSLCQHISAQEPSWEPARPNTSVDALNTAIILCLVGTVGGWRGRNGRRPTICGKSAATKKPRWDSFAADLRRRDALACQHILIVHHSNGPHYLISIFFEKLAKKFLVRDELQRQKSRLLFSSIGKLKSRSLLISSIFLLNLRQQGIYGINKNPHICKRFLRLHRELHNLKNTRVSLSYIRLIHLILLCRSHKHINPFISSSHCRRF